MDPNLNLTESIVLNLQEPDDTFTLSSTTYGYPYGYDYANVSVAGASGSNSCPNVTIGGSGSGLTYTSGVGISSPLWSTTAASPWLGNGLSVDPDQSGKLTLSGENADVVVNGKSMIDMLERIEQRLNLLTPNEKMEAEWEELRVLGEQYRALEAKLKEQGEMWAKLKAMPPPTID